MEEDVVQLRGERHVHSVMMEPALYPTRTLVLIGVMFLGLGCGADAPADLESDGLAASSTRPAVRSAFFGVDQVVMTPVARCGGARPNDGIPVVFDAEVDATTLDPAGGDFVVNLDSGPVRPVCATLAPSDEANENRTVLLVGQFGDATSPPRSVEVVGDLLRETDGANYLGAMSTSVVALAEGPSLVAAERMAADEAELGESNDCPAGTAQVIKVYWQGGVSAPSGAELGDTERLRHSVTVIDGARRRTVVPFALGDLMDNDYVVDLCLDTTLRVSGVTVEPSTVIDPRGDLNPATTIALR